MGAWIRFAFFLLFLLFQARDAHSQGGFAAWVGLYEPSHLGWLENENRLGDLCPDADRLDECYAEKLSPLVVTYRLHDEPDHSAR